MLNTSIVWLYRQHHDGIQRSGSAQCYLCGTPCPQEHSVAKGLSDTFNSHALAARPSSSWLCDACHWYFDSHAGHDDFRKMSIVVGPHSWRVWDRVTMKRDIVHWLTFGLDDDAFIVCSLSKKKHILLSAPLNSAGCTTLAVQVEENVAYLDLASWLSIERPFLRLIALGHGKGEILSGNLFGATIRKHGQIHDVLQLNQDLAPWRASALLEFYSYVTIVERESEDSGDGSGDRDSTGTGTVSTRSRGATNRRSAPAVGLEWDGQRLPEQVSHGDLAHVRRESGDRLTDYEQLSLFLE